MNKNGVNYSSLFPVCVLILHLMQVTPSIHIFLKQRIAIEFFQVFQLFQIYSFKCTLKHQDDSLSTLGNLFYGKFQY